MYFSDGGSSAVQRGSADLSEPVDPSALGIQNQYLPPFTSSQSSAKQQFTYPQNSHSQYQQSQSFSSAHGQAASRGSFGNSGSNGEFLRQAHIDKDYIHHDKPQLVEAIQRLFVRDPHRVIESSVETLPSHEKESYSFNYDNQLRRY